MKIIDISLPIKADMVTWRDNHPPVLERYRNVETGAPCNNSIYKAELHVGTHVDAPNHFLKDGKTIEQVNLERFMGPCQVVYLDVPVITAKVLEATTLQPSPRYLFKTANSYAGGKFNPSYTALDGTAAQWLLQREVVLVGVDYLSIETFQNPGAVAHKLLLEKEVALLEGLYLDHVEPGAYWLSALPLPIVGAEASPVRAVLLPATLGGFK